MPHMLFGVPVQCFAHSSVRLSAWDQTLKYGSTVTSGVAGGRKSRAAADDVIAKTPINIVSRDNRNATRVVFTSVIDFDMVSLLQPSLSPDVSMSPPDWYKDNSDLLSKHTLDNKKQRWRMVELGKNNRCFLLDMDGVLVRGRSPIPGAQELIARLQSNEIPFLILTNNPMYTPRDLQHRLQSEGLDVPEDHLYTSAMATAKFLDTQRPGGSAFVIGESGLTQALHDIGYILTSRDPDYVILGETTFYNFERIAQAIRYVAAGARFIATNPDPIGPSEKGMLPACGAMAALIEKATGVSPYFIGKPNPLMMRSALRYLQAHSEGTVMVGDRMDTDVVAGMESGMETILVLTGVTKAEEVERFPYRPTRVLNSVADIEIP